MPQHLWQDLSKQNDCCSQLFNMDVWVRTSKKPYIHWIRYPSNYRCNQMRSMSSNHDTDNTHPRLRQHKLGPTFFAGWSARNVYDCGSRTNRNKQTTEQHNQPDKICITTKTDLISACNSILIAIGMHVDIGHRRCRCSRLFKSTSLDSSKYVDFVALGSFAFYGYGRMWRKPERNAYISVHKLWWHISC